VLAQLKQKYESRGVYFVSLTLEENDTRQAVTDWLERANATGLRSGRASDGTAKKLHEFGGQRYGPIPSNVFLSSNGDVVEVMIGARGHDVLEQAVQRIANK
jgi:hypothetical protein